MALTDTHPAAEQLHLKMLRDATFEQRLNMAFDLTETTRALSWRGLKERYSGESIPSLVERFIFLLYKDRGLAKKAAERYMEVCGKLNIQFKK